MGLWAWMTNQYFTKKFWKLLKKDGFLLTYTRGHRAVMHAHSVGGYSENAKFVGSDQYGNKYYEDFDCFHVNQRRWVQMADYLLTIGNNGDRIPPGWQGWLTGTYDDVPQFGADQFVRPFYLKDHEWSTSFSVNKVYIPKHCVQHPENLEFKQRRKNRYAIQWNPTTKRQTI